MKSFLKAVASRMVRPDFLWRWLDATLVKGTHFLERERCKYQESRRLLPEQLVVDRAIRNHCPDLKVRHGFFRGMQYPQVKSVSSALFPKLLGTYERELHPVLEKICRQPYTEIVNIGCAEGYYAVGLALRIPGAKVYAFDTNQEAIRLCRDMAALNQVAERLVTGAFCDAAVLKASLFTGKALIVCDCEGYEKTLFTQEIVNFLAAHDVLMEVHDGVDITISAYIQSVFAPTHRIEIIESLDDIKKAQTYSYPELQSYDLAGRKTLVGEGRPHIMTWLFIQSQKLPSAVGAPTNGSI
jgi:hypothetical protein